jgi:HEAT repeat protein
MLATERDDSVRIAVVGELTLARQFDPVVSALSRDKSVAVRVAAVRGLASAGNLDAVSASLQQEQPAAVIIAGAEALLKDSAPRPLGDVIDALLPIVKQGSNTSASQTILHIAKRLAHTNDPDSIARLIPALVSIEGSFRLPKDHKEAAKSWLPALGPASVGPLVNALRAEASFAVIGALGQIKSPEGIDALTVTLLDSGKTGLQDAAAQALASIGGPRAIEALRRAIVEADGRVKLTSAKLLGQLRDAGSTDVIAAMLSHEKEEVRLAGVTALGSLGAPEASAALARALEADPLEKVRGAVIDVLARLNDNNSQAAIGSALNTDRSLAVRLHAFAALQNNHKPMSATAATTLLLEHVKSGSGASSTALSTVAATAGMKTELIEAAVLAVRGEPIGNRISSHGTHTNYYADYLNMDPGREAVKKLCGTKNQFTSDALRLVAARQNVVVHLSSDCSPSWSETADFSEWRQLARQELIRRGIPA